MIKEITTDVLIIGAGPAGLSAAIYAARANKKTLVLKGRNISHLEMAHRVDNYPGVSGVSGPQLLDLIQKQANDFGAEIIEGDVLETALDFEPKMVTTRNEIIYAKTVILATGKGRHGKGIKNEESFIGTGLSYCATCDGAFYKGKKVAVYGGDSEAVDDAVMLKQLGCDVSLIYSENTNNCPDEVLENAAKNGIEIISDTKVLEAKGSGSLSAVKIRNDKGVEMELNFEGLFVIKPLPSSTLLSRAGISLDAKECVSVDREMQTSIPGVFAAGDMVCGGAQVAIANGQGVAAALSALKYIRTAA